jgi:hypothetical protein
VHANGDHEDRAGGRAIGIAVAVLGSMLLLLPPLLGEQRLREQMWAFDALRDVPLALRVLGCTIVWSSVLPSTQRALTRLSEGAVAHGRLSLAMVLAVGMALGAWGRQRNFELGDSAHLINFLSFEVHTRGQLVTYDEPLSLFFHSHAYRVLHSAFDAKVEDAYSLLSILAGAVTWLAVATLWSRVEPRPAARVLALLLFGASATNQLFFGYVENYTLVTACSLVYILLAERALTGSLSPAVPAFALGVAASFHVLSGWLGLSLLWLWWLQPDRRLAGLGAIVLAGAMPLILTIGSMSLAGVPLSSLSDTHLAALKFIFLIDPGSEIFVYPAFSPAHWNDIGNQWLLVSLPGTLAALAGVVLARGQISWRDPLLGFLAAASLGVHAFAATWNAEIGAYNDWDLFSSMGLIDALLGARVLLLASRDSRALLAAGLPIATLGLLLTGAFIWSNATREVLVPGRDTVHAYAHMTSARALREAGAHDAAAASLQDALRENPDYPPLLFERARVAWETRDASGAQHFFEHYLRVEPEGPRADQVRAALRQLGTGESPAAK